MITGVDLISDSLAIMLDGSGGGSAVMDEKTITDNGVYYPRDETPPLDGYNKVTVNVLADEQILLYIYYLKYGKWYDPDDPAHDPESPDYDPDDKLPETPVEVIEYIDDVDDDSYEDGYTDGEEDPPVPPAKPVPKPKYIDPETGVIYNVEVKPTNYKWQNTSGQAHPNFNNYYNVNPVRMELSGDGYLRPIVAVTVNGITGYHNMNVGGFFGNDMRITQVGASLNNNLITLICDWEILRGSTWDQMHNEYTLMINS